MSVIYTAGCSLLRQPAAPDRLGEDIESHPAVVEDETQADPRSRASAELLRQACELLEAQRVDDAIDLLERSIALDPKEGRVYYFLARGWMMKGDFVQALEFNRLAWIYLEYDPVWKEKIGLQEVEIEQLRQAEDGP